MQVDQIYALKPNLYTHGKAIHMVWDGNRWRNLPLMICRGDPQGIRLALLILLPSAKPADIPYFPLANDPTAANFVHFYSVVSEMEQSETAETLDQIIARKIETVDNSAVYLDKITSKHNKIFGYEIGPDKFNPRMAHWLNSIRSEEFALTDKYYQAIFSNIVNEIENDKETYYTRAMTLCKMLTKTKVTRAFLHAAQILKSHCLAMRRDLDDTNFGDEDTKKYFFDEKNMPGLGTLISDYVRDYTASPKINTNIPNATLIHADAEAIAGYAQYKRTEKMMGGLNDVAGRTMALPKTAIMNRQRAQRNRAAIDEVREKRNAARKQQEREKEERKNVKWTPPGFAYSQADNYVVYYVDEDGNVQSGAAGLNEVILPRTAHIGELTIGGNQVRFQEAEDDDHAEQWSARNPAWKYAVRF